MNNSSSAVTNAENVIGAIVFPVLFAIVACGAAMIPLVGGLVAMAVSIGIGYFVAWCNAPLWCKSAMLLGAVTGFLGAAFLVKGGGVRFFIGVGMLAICFLTGLIVRRRTNPPR